MDIIHKNKKWSCHDGKSTTGDMLIGMKKSLNNHVWMLRAYLTKES